MPTFLAYITYIHAFSPLYSIRISIPVLPFFLVHMCVLDVLFFFFVCFIFHSAVAYRRLMIRLDEFVESRFELKIQRVGQRDNGIDSDLLIFSGLGKAGITLEEVGIQLSE